MEMLQALTAECNVGAFEQALTQRVFGQLSLTPTREEVRQVYLTLQHVFHEYRKANQCRASAFPHVHRCLYPVYCDAYERIVALESKLPPAAPARKPRKSTVAVAPPPTPEELAASLLKEIERAGRNKP